jgi:hypothetical protein
MISVDIVTTGGRDMARKTTGSKKMPAHAEMELRSVRLQLPVEEHKKLRRLAADNDTNMAVLVRRIVLDYIGRHYKGRPE